MNVLISPLSLIIILISVLVIKGLFVVRMTTMELKVRK